MFEKNQKIRPEEAETVIGAGVKVEGTFSALGNVIVKGEVSGSVETKSNLAVREGGGIEADIKAKNASIAGDVKGNLDVEEKIELASTAKVKGDLNCRVLAIDEGAILNGHCSVGGESGVEKEEERPEGVEEE